MYNSVKVPQKLARKIVLEFIDWIDMSKSGTNYLFQKELCLLLYLEIYLIY